MAAPYFAMSLNTAETTPTSIEPTIPPAVRGWLLFLCVVLTILYPAINLHHILTYTVPLIIRYPGFSILMLSRCVVWTALAVFSFLAGLKLWLVRPGAVRFARRWLWSYLIAHIAEFALFLVVAKPRQFASVAWTGWFYVVVPIASFAFWYLYLEHSRRVRATYPRG